MSELMGQDDGNLVFVGQHVVEPRVDTEVVANRAEGVEALLVVDEVIVGLVVYGRIDGADSCREVGHDAIELLVERPVLIHAVLFFHLAEVFLTSFLGVIVLAQESIELRMGGNTADDCAEDAGGTGFCGRSWDCAEG